MWILDSSPRGRALAWGCRGEGSRVLPAIPSFLLHLPDPHGHRDLLEGLSGRYPVEECTFSTVYGPLGGYRVAAGREVAEQVERQTHCTADLYNVDLRLDQRAMAEAGLVPCSYPASRGSPSTSPCRCRWLRWRPWGTPTATAPSPPSR